MKIYIDRSRYDLLQEATAKKRQTLINYAYVAGRTKRTREILPTSVSYSHFATVASFPTSIQVEFLQWASEEKWSVKRLRIEVRKYKEHLKN